MNRLNGWKLVIEGHCDERGTAEYNHVLGKRRAQAVKRYLDGQLQKR
ncbi:MAG: OmpA family protein [Nitrospirota bacterium]|nr:OmpA family protein [Nitrospirota bacterium]